MPAAAVIPAPIAYIKVVAVKKLVVELWGRQNALAFRRGRSAHFFFWGIAVPLSGCSGDPELLP